MRRCDFRRRAHCAVRHPDSDTIGALLSAIGIAAWTVSCASTSWQCPAARWRLPATSTRCCWTRPARSPSATGRRPSSFRCRRQRPRAGRRRAAGQPQRRYAGGPLRRRARQGEVRHARPRYGAAACNVRPFTAQTRMSGVDVAGSSIRKGAVESVVEYALGKQPAPRELTAIAEGIAKSGARRSRSSRTAGCSASSTSRTSSRAASANASPSCGRWACARS